VAEDLSHAQRFAVLRSTLENWPLVALDKLGLLRCCRYRTRSGFQVWCRSRTPDVNEAVAILSGFEYPRELALLPPGGVVVDAGANIGSFTLLVAEVNGLAAIHGVAFEPFPENFTMLQRNIEVNEITSITPVRAALSNMDGSVRLATPGMPDEVRVVRSDDESSDLEVVAWRLSSYCAHVGIESIQLLKLDVEGSEYEIVESDLEFIGTCVDRLLIEYHDLGAEQNGDALRNTLEPYFVVTPVHRRSRTGVLHCVNRQLQERARPHR
jgi:FkbM family methyltransferase